MYKILFFISLFSLLNLTESLGQKLEKELLARTYIVENLDKLQLNSVDIAEMYLTDQFTTKHNGVYHLYFQQFYKGIPVFNSLLNVSVSKRDKVLISANQFIHNIHKKANSPKAAIRAENAILSAANALELSFDRNQRIDLVQHNANRYLYKASGISNTDIPVQLMYFPDRSGKLRLIWNLELDVKENADYWNVNIDAKSGDLLSKNNYTSYCDFNINSFIHKTNRDEHKILSSANQTTWSEALNLTPTQASYKVFPFPGESPNHIEFTRVDNPADSIASPFGWHDIDGVHGNEFTITRGNNVHAYLDELDQDTPSDFEPDGGENLEFLFDYRGDMEPDSNKSAAVVNLFYINNMVHDISYRLGFDEAAGNFQANNYSNEGLANDYVNAQAFDGGGENNANFSTPKDGNNGRMQMYLWSRSDELRLEINEPIQIGGLYETGKAGDGFGPDMDQILVTGDIILLEDNTNKPNLGCGTTANVTEITGNIALIDRGECQFGSKVWYAEQAGAIAVLICNVKGVNGGNGDELINMSGGNDGSKVSIPSLFAKKTTCDLIKIAIGNGENINVTMGLQQLGGPSKHAGSFDNGVITHEFAHGISTRLTGGPSNSSCLYNPDIDGDGNADGEQMGEGWSDFYALAYSTMPGDKGSDARGIGTYVSGQQVNGRGIRHYPYSTDLGISPVTYDFIKTTNIPHGVGEVWAAVLWDMYWKFIDLYGFDPSLTDSESGNFKALLLVTDGLKLQPCNPGFLDGRDAIIDADILNFDGENECLLWEIFARRGMGYFAEQGNPFDHRDGVENFDPKPTCIAELKLQESYNPIIIPGDTMEVSLKIINHKTDSVTNVIVVDYLPEGLELLNGSSSISVDNTDGLLTFNLGTMQSLEEIEIKYSLIADLGVYSKSVFLDNMEESEDLWLGINNVGDETFWDLTDVAPHSELLSWYVGESSLESDISLIMLHESILISGEAPALSFYHSYNTETLTDGGFVEYSVDEGDTWNQFSQEDFIHNTYTGGLSYSTIAIPGLQAFYGNSEGYIKSYIDLSFLKGEQVIFSFRYGTDDNTIVEADYPGWFVDDVEVVELKHYQRNICVQSEEGDNVCLDSKILIDSKVVDSSKDIQKAHAELNIAPNPTRGQIQLYIDSSIDEFIKISVLSVEGKEVLSDYRQVFNGKQILSLNVADLNTGIYYVEIKSNKLNGIKKLIIQK